MARGILAKDTHGSTVRFAPPLVASDDDIALLVSRRSPRSSPRAES